MSNDTGMVAFDIDRMLALPRTVPMSRVHLALNLVDSVACYSLSGEGFTGKEMNATCRFATKDKVWVPAPDQERWKLSTPEVAAR